MHQVQVCANFIAISLHANKFHALQKKGNADTLYSTIGRTTFVNTLCSKGVLTHKDSDDPTDAHVEEGVKIKPITVGKILVT